MRLEPLALGGQPSFEGIRRRANAVEKLTAVERGRTSQPGRIDRPQNLLEFVDISFDHVRVNSNAVAICRNHGSILRQHMTQREEDLSKTRARAFSEPPVP